MKVIKLTEQEVKNLLVFLVGNNRLQLTGNEAFEFTNIVNKIYNAEDEVIISVKEEDVEEIPHQE